MSDRDLDLVREGLDDGCAWGCGCDDSGNESKCVHAGRYSALSRLEERLATAERERDEEHACYMDAVEVFGAEQARASQLAEALRQARDVISSPTRPSHSDPQQDIYDTPMMGRALREIDAALAACPQDRPGEQT